MDQKPNQTPKRFDQNQNRSDGPNRNQNQNGGQNNNNNRSQFQRYLPLLIIAVLFTLLLGLLFLHDALPGPAGWAGLILIVAGMVFNSLSAGRKHGL